ncbi:MAG: hypothetical protein RDV48_11230 [Candidatus Eremiobacteraeota bacterium]|nr:hypothetical protein [Candidatus Eremiobacteraeota bacterium]
MIERILRFLGLMERESPRPAPRQASRPAQAHSVPAEQPVRAPSVSVTFSEQAALQVPQKEEVQFAYRPRAGPVPGLVMRNLDDSDTGIFRQGDLKDVHDAFTGRMIDPAGDVFQCRKCKVHYQALSVQVLRDMNGSRCVSCHSMEIVPISSNGPFSIGAAFVPAVVTLNNYTRYVGQVITFQGYVPRVNVSRDGRSYAVMFQDRSWNNGLKMTVFKGTVRASGGSRFLKGLQGRTIRIRGLLTDHPVFGYEITVSHRSMILEIQ